MRTAMSPRTSTDVPPEAGQDEGAEGGVVGHADDHFHAVADLLLDEEFRGVLGDAGFGQDGADGGHRVGCGLRAVDAESDAADVAFVDGRSDFDCDRPAELGLGGRGWACWRSWAWSIRSR